MLATQCRAEEMGTSQNPGADVVPVAGLAGGDSEISDYDLRISVLGATVDADG